MRNTPSTLGVINDFNFAYHHIRQLNLPKDIRAAIVVSPGDDSHNFQKMVASNAGYAIELFEDQESAVDWLLIDI